MRLAFLTLISLFLIAAGCSGGDETGGSTGGSSTAPNVVATTTQIGDFARNVGGDHIALTVLVKPNQDVHDFVLTPSQIQAVSGADLVLRNGLELDAFLDKALEGAHGAVAVLSAGVETRAGEEEHEEGEDHDAPGHNEEGHEHGGTDPHIWFSVANAHRMVENLRDALIAQDAANAESYRANADAYLQQLDALDAEIREKVASVPEACRKLVTDHDAFGYYADAYGFEVIGTVIPSTTTQAQASASDVAELIDLIKAENVPAIFSEASANPDLIQQVGRESGAQVIDDLYGDSLGPEGSDGATYIGMMRSNTQKITEALKDCDVS
jgi:ABC-type Zn uptake system ZnuABC Zn-binding protein ZnuA